VLQYLSDITEKHIETIRCCMNDVQSEYEPDRSLMLRVYSISQRLSENPSMYQLSSEELDIVCMCLNDSLSILDELSSEINSNDRSEMMEHMSYSEDISEILRVLQRN
jgi:hypothetical protein